MGIITDKDIIDKIANIFPWEFLNTKEESKNKNEDFFNPKFEKLKNNPSLISVIYKTNESIKGNKDAIAGINYLSNDNVKVKWEIKENNFTRHQKQLIPNIYTNEIKIESKKINLTNYYHIKEGPSDILSKSTYKFLGQPKIENKSIATLLQYNNVYTKIGIVTIFIAIFVIIISRFIKKLMHDVH